MRNYYIDSEKVQFEPGISVKTTRIWAGKGGSNPQESSNINQNLLLVAASTIPRRRMEIFRKHSQRTHVPVRSECVELSILPDGSLEETLNRKCQKYTVCYQYAPTGSIYIPLTTHEFKELICD